MKGNQLNIGIHGSGYIPNKWGNICIDLWEVLKKNKVINKDYGSYLLKGIQIMSSQLIRGVFITDSYIEGFTLPKEMQYKGW